MCEREGEGRREGECEREGGGKENVREGNSE